MCFNIEIMENNLRWSKNLQKQIVFEASYLITKVMLKKPWFVMKGALGKIILNKTITLVLKSKEAFTNLELIAKSCSSFFDRNCSKTF